MALLINTQRSTILEPQVRTVTFVVTRKTSPDGHYPYTILRISGIRQDVVSYHATMDEAAEAALRYASKARFSGLDARIFQRNWLIEGAAESLGPA